jgi:hypothetical protein
MSTEQNQQQRKTDWKYAYVNSQDTYTLVTEDGEELGGVTPDFTSRFRGSSKVTGKQQSFPLLFQAKRFVEEEWIRSLKPKLTNEEQRQEFAQKLIGKTVEVYKLGTIRPENEGNVMYLPLPEYGICLLHRLKNQTS